MSDESGLESIVELLLLADGAILGGILAAFAGVSYHEYRRYKKATQLLKAAPASNVRGLASCLAAESLLTSSSVRRSDAAASGLRDAARDSTASTSDVFPSGTVDLGPLIAVEGEACGIASGYETFKEKCLPGAWKDFWTGERLIHQVSIKTNYWQLYGPHYGVGSPLGNLPRTGESTLQTIIGFQKRPFGLRDAGVEDPGCLSWMLQQAVRPREGQDGGGGPATTKITYNTSSPTISSSTATSAATSSSSSSRVTGGHTANMLLVDTETLRPGFGVLPLQLLAETEMKLEESEHVALSALRFLLGGKVPVSRARQEWGLQAGTPLTAFGHLSKTKDGQWVISPSVHELPHFLTQGTREQVLEDLECHARGHGWIALIIGSLALGIFTYGLGRQVWQRCPRVRWWGRWAWATMFGEQGYWPRLKARLSRKPPPVAEPEPVEEMPDPEETAAETFFGGRPLCIVCESRRKRAVFLPCGHCACCMTCARRVYQAEGARFTAVVRGDYGHCPLCRKELTGIVRLLA